VQGAKKRGALGHGLFGLCVKPSLFIHPFSSPVYLVDPFGNKQQDVEQAVRNWVYGHVCVI